MKYLHQAGDLPFGDHVLFPTTDAIDIHRDQILVVCAVIVIIILIIIIIVTLKRIKAKKIEKSIDELDDLEDVKTEQGKEELKENNSK